MPPLFAPLRATDVAEGAAQLAQWLRCCGRSAVDDAASNAVPLARWAGAAAHGAAEAALRALDAAGRGVATCVPEARVLLLNSGGADVCASRRGSTAPAQRESAGIVDAMDKLRKGMREGLVGACCSARRVQGLHTCCSDAPAPASARLPQRMPFEALRAHTASRFF